MQTNFLVIGSGISGLNFALNAASKGKVIIATKKKIVDSNTNYAQGGIAAVLNKTDDIKKHIEDTLKAGAYHNKKSAVKFLVENSAQAIYHLINLGVEFEKENGELKLTKEGGHSQRRIAYVGDFTGKEIERILIKRVKEHPNITILQNTFALDLITKEESCYGAYIIHKGKVEAILANQTILATGGIGQLYTSTTNAKIATGDGIAMGIRAGLKAKDMEFIQFHPTALDVQSFPRFLISEAVRGEGAKLLNHQHKEFTDPLAPRDKVSKDIYQELKKGPVYLDITSKSKSYLLGRFPQIYAHLTQKGYHMEKDLIPVTPAAHYLCGGISTDLHGRTKIKNLYAFGEVAHTGVHGANRLASNSLLEALVFSNQILKNLKTSKIPALKLHSPKLSNETKLAKKAKKEIQKIMWNYAGIIRNTKQIQNIAIPKMKQIIKDLEKIKGTNQDLAEARNMAKCSHEILNAASKRKKTLGCHTIERLGTKSNN
ncbi:L-aspartate oxidase [Candidatus Peregrinibacteria bacterium CG10_big_fil_rev_8_21_14_0_10_36_19]|nr:MAG: L-aspartate oxidase [Candidatus Peregrinibacteria bacterium CG10_big_fil_rev_8_21_14_0_10_36_19]